MSRNLKILGMLLAAAVASSALLASTTSATETLSAYFISGVGGGETAKFDGGQIGTNTFTFKSASLTCSAVNLTGQALTAGETSTEIKLEPTFENCHASLLGVPKPATVTTNGCYYLLNATTTITEESEFDQPVDFKIECPTGKQVEAHVYESEAEEKTLCTYDIKAQGPLSGVTATNIENTPTSVDDVVLDINLSLAATNTKPSLLCGAGESITVAYKGESTLKATNASGSEVELQELRQKRFYVGVAKDNEPAFVTGTGGTVKFTSGAGEITCTAHYIGTNASREVKEISITPTYTNCKAFGYVDTDFNFEGCTYLFTLEKGLFYTTGGKLSHTHGPMHIVCPPNKTIVIQPTEAKVPVCTIKIYAQLPIQPLVDQKNESPGKANERQVLLTSTIKGLGWEVEGGGGKCGEEGKTITTTVDGAITMKAFKDIGGKISAEQVGFQIVGTGAP